MKSLWDQNQGLELGLAAERASLCGGRERIVEALEAKDSGWKGGWIPLVMSK